MSKNFTLDVTKPATSEAPSGGAAAIQLLKNALHERLNEDLYFEKSGDTIDGDNVGYHRKCTLMKLSDDPTEITDMGIVYTKDVSGVPELFFKDEGGNEVQLTSGGKLNADAFISGDLLLTTNTGAKSGWTDKSTTYANKFLRVAATAGSTGGADTHTHTEIGGLAADATSSTIAVGAGAGVTVTQATHTHAVTGTTASGNNVPAYITVRMYQKD